MLKLLADILTPNNELPNPTYGCPKGMSVVERFKHLFENVNDAKLMRWHVEGRKSDGMLRYPGDSPQWRTIDGKRSGLCYDWIRARTKPQEGGGYYFPNEKTKEVFQKMGELESQVSDGSWTPQGHDDILSRALGSKEHGGRVRGVGGLAKIKDVFGSGKNKHIGVVSVDELATITQQITMKVQQERKERMNQMMNSKLEGIFNHLKQMGVLLPDNFLNDVGTPRNETVRSSCQSVQREDHFSNLKNPTLCRLCVIHLEKGKVVVARGTVFPSNSQGDNMIHNNPIASHNVRVSVDDIVPEYQLTPLPVTCEEHETVGNAACSFVQWPKDLVMLGQDPISSEKEKDHEMSPKRIVQMPKKVERKGSATPMKKTPIVLGDDIIPREHCRSLCFLLKKRPSSKKDEVFKFEGNGEDPIYIVHEDVDQFLKMSCLNIPILEIFVKYVSRLCNQLKDEMFAFMLPSRLAIPHIRDYQRQQEATEYMTDFLVANKERRFILAPYIQDNHWMLLLFCLYESVIYVFDPLKKERKIHLTTPARTAFKLYVPQGGSRNNRKEFLWCRTKVQCPQQGGGTLCGFFVMRYMHDIIMLAQKNPDIDWKVGLGSRSYTRKEICEVRELWANFFTVECL